MKFAAAQESLQPVLQRQPVASQPESRAAQLLAAARLRHQQALSKTASSGEPAQLSARSIPIHVSERVLQELVASRREETRYFGAALGAEGHVGKAIASLEATMGTSPGPSLSNTSEMALHSKPKYTASLPPVNLSGYSRAAAREDVLDVIMEIEHSEAAASVDEREAAQIVALQHANFIERNINRSCSFGHAHARAAAQVRFGGVETWCEEANEVWQCGDSFDGESGDESCHQEIIGDQVVLGKLNRVPMPLRDELANGPSLRFCRERLDKAGYPWRLFSGAYIFVHPWQYRETMLALGDCDLRPYHVVYAASLASPLQEALARCKGAWMLTRGPVQTSLDEASRLGEGLDTGSCQRSIPDTGSIPEPLSGAEDDDIIDLSEIVTRTFIHQRPRSARLERMCTASDSAACCLENHRIVAPWDC